MSVLIPRVKVYCKIYRKIQSYSFRTVCDINYCRTFYGMVEDTIQQIVKTWCDLNEESYCLRCKEKEKIGLRDYISPDDEETISTMQMLKYLQCIKYNIEEDEIKQVRNLTLIEEKYLKLLDDAIKEIQLVIISEMPEYQDAKWCE